jgi:hypothetical protein
MSCLVFSVRRCWTYPFPNLQYEGRTLVGHLAAFFQYILSYPSYMQAVFATRK